MQSHDANLDLLVVVLVSTRNPLNIGAAARAMSNFGFADLRLVNPYDLAFREAKSAVGAADVLADARVYTNIADAVADCSLVVGTTAGRNRQLEQELNPLPRAGKQIRTTMLSGHVALLFGSEKRGLSNDDLSYCHWLMRIPTTECAPAMNLGQAVAVCLYELVRAGATIEKVKNPASKITASELKRLHTTLMEALEISKYTKIDEAKIQRLLLRLNLTVQDSTTLLGILRQMLWKMRS